MNEAAWRQPSIILLDDLDHVTASPLGPEQEIGPEAVYHTRLAEGKSESKHNSVVFSLSVDLINLLSDRSLFHPLWFGSLNDK